MPRKQNARPQAQPQQLVVYKAKPQGAKAPKQKQTSALRKTADESLRCYASALLKPFSKQALGAVVPDMYSYPTATYHCEGTITLTSSASGVASVIMTPDPYCSLIDMQSSCVSTSSMFNYGTAYNAFAACSQPNLSAALTNYRVVGGGIQIRNLLPPTTATGRLLAATVPMSDSMPGPGQLSNLSVSNYTLCRRAAGITPNSGSNTSQGTLGLPASILQLPNAVECTIQDLIAQTMSINFKPVTANSFEFKSTVNDSSVGFLGTNVFSDQPATGAASGTSIAALGDSYASKQPTGFDCILLRFEGLPANTICADIRYVYHFEGTPAITNSVGSIVPAAKADTVIDIAGHQRVLDSVLSKPNILLGVEVLGAGIAGYGQNGIAGAALGMAAKLGFTI
jgi:hypothetical protein